tara:strand:- start:19439 stop:21541 length:2103 start_codon:yes stop_codon:yes gene_type:complete
MGAGYASLDKPTDDTQQRTRLAIQDAQAEGVTLPQAPSGSKRGRARAVELNLPKTGQFQSRGRALSTDIPEHYRTGVERGYDPERSGYVDKLGRFAGEATEGLNPITIAKGIKDLVTTNPVTTVKNIWGAHGNVMNEAKGALDAGDYGTAAAKFLSGAIPLLGLRANEAINLAKGGDIAGALGAGVDIASIFATAGGGGSRLAGSLAKRGAVGAKAPVIGMRGPRQFMKHEPQQIQDAIKWAEDKGIPLPRSVYGAGKDIVERKVLPHQFGAQQVAAKAERATEEAMKAQAQTFRTRAGSMADEPLELVESGIQFQDELKALKGSIEDVQKSRYKSVEDRIAAMKPERGPSRFETQPAAGLLDEFGQPITKRVEIPAPALQAPIDVRPFKANIRKLRDEYDTTYAGNIVERAGGEGLANLKQIEMMGDTVPLIELEQVLSALKSTGRKSKTMRQMRSYKTAMDSIEDLSKTVEKSARKVGVWDDLSEARRATSQKYEVQGLLDDLGEDASAMMDKLLANKGRNLDLLKDAENIMPGINKRLGAAWMDDQLIKATSTKHFKGGEKMYGDWQKIGKTKREQLFDADVINDYDKFVTVHKRLAFDPNPSGTASTFIGAGVAAPMGIVNWARAKMLWGPTSVGRNQWRRMLIDGMNIPITNTTMTTKWLADMLRLNAQAQSEAAAATPASAPTVVNEPVERMEP